MATQTVKNVGNKRLTNKEIEGFLQNLNDDRSEASNESGASELPSDDDCLLDRESPSSESSEETDGSDPDFEDEDSGSRKSTATCSNDASSSRKATPAAAAPRVRKRGSGRQEESHDPTIGTDLVSPSTTTGRNTHRAPETNVGKGKRSTGTSLKLGNKLSAPDGTEWELIPVGKSKAGRAAQKNVVKIKPGPTAFAKRHIVDDEASSAWNLIIDETILKHIKKCTEAEARRVNANAEWTVSLEELRAFIAIMYARGATSAKDVDLHFLWSDNWGISFCKNTMSRDKFSEILRYLRFDDKSTRKSRLKEDKFALVSFVWDRFVENSQSCFIPGPFLCVDEQLFPTKTRCRFIQYIASKPDKFGIKFWVAVDVEHKYVVNIFPYLGKDDARPTSERLSDHIVLKLIEPYLGQGRNVTCDNFFTSIKLCNALKKKRTTIVGTVNRIRREIPQEVKKCRDAVNSTHLLKTEDGTTLTVYQGKKNKNVLLLSSMHESVGVTSGDKKKPDTVVFYNQTKYGVDVVDQMCRKYSTKAASRRWTLQVFCNMIDIAAINAWVLYKSVTDKKISRRDFILKLAEEFKESHKNQSLIAEPNDPEPARGCGMKRQHCQVLENCKKLKGSHTCKTCGKVACKKCTAVDHRLVTCVNCVD